MSWLDKILPSRIRAEKESKGSVPEGLWHKCLNCDTVIYRAEFEKNLNVCPKCNHHLRIDRRYLKCLYAQACNLSYFFLYNYELILVILH